MQLEESVVLRSRTFQWVYPLLQHSNKLLNDLVEEDVIKRFKLDGLDYESFKDRNIPLLTAHADGSRMIKTIENGPINPLEYF